MPTNKIRELRKKLNLTQKQLANSAGTSQQQVQRLESGIQAARFDLALRICAALEAPMEVVFPETKKTIRRTVSKGETVGEMLKDKRAATELSAAGIDTDFDQWTLKHLLQSGHIAIHRIGSKEKDHVWNIVQSGKDSLIRFFVYDTDTHRIAINLSRLVFTHFLFDPPTVHIVGNDGKEEARDGVEVITAASKEAYAFGIDPDGSDLSDEPDADDAQLQHMFLMIELSHEDSDVIHFTDVDGETVFFQLDKVEMISVPLWAVEPKLFESEMEGDLEDWERAEQPE